MILVRWKRCLQTLLQRWSLFTPSAIQTVIPVALSGKDVGSALN